MPCEVGFFAFGEYTRGPHTLQEILIYGVKQHVRDCKNTYDTDSKPSEYCYNDEKVMFNLTSITHQQSWIANDSLLIV